MRYLFLLSFLILLAGCRRENSARLPEGLSSDSVIPREEMVRMLSDVQVLEAFLQLDVARGKNVTRMRDFYYDRLFSRYHCTEKRFRKNLEYYEQNPETFAKMYEEVVATLDTSDKAHPKK